jgi:hypothetical protein
MASSDIKPYPLMFDPSQWANPYTQWNKQALPFMGQYAGTPTDARGNPIQSYVDAQAAHNAWQPPQPAQAPPVTLNSTPQQGGLSFAQFAPPSPGGPSTQAQYAYNLGLGGLGPASAINPGSAQGQAIMAARQPAAPAAPPTNPVDMNAAYLQALSNPGRISTPGATVAQSPAPSAQSGVLQQFLANWKPGANPAGNYNPNLFPDALRGTV